MYPQALGLEREFDRPVYKLYDLTERLNRLSLKPQYEMK